MDDDKPLSAVPISAHLAGRKTPLRQDIISVDYIVDIGIEVVGSLEENNSTTQLKYYVVVYLGFKEVTQSEKKPQVPAPQWKWPEDHQL